MRSFDTHAPRAGTMVAAVDEPRVRRGYVITYRPGQPNFCPGCGHSHWHVGRSTVECARCETALPIAADPRRQREPLAPGWRNWLNPAGWRTLLPAG